MLKKLDIFTLPRGSGTPEHLPHIVAWLGKVRNYLVAFNDAHLREEGYERLGSDATVLDPTRRMSDVGISTMLDVTMTLADGSHSGQRKLVFLRGKGIGNLVIVPDSLTDITEDADEIVVTFAPYSVDLMWDGNTWLIERRGGDNTGTMAAQDADAVAISGGEAVLAGLQLNLTTDDVTVVDADETGGTDDGSVQLLVGTATKYIRLNDTP